MSKEVTTQPNRTADGKQINTATAEPTNIAHESFKERLDMWRLQRMQRKEIDAELKEWFAPKSTSNHADQRNRDHSGSILCGALVGVPVAVCTAAAYFSGAFNTLTNFLTTAGNGIYAAVGAVAAVVIGGAIILSCTTSGDKKSQTQDNSDTSRQETGFWYPHKDYMRYEDM